METADAVIAGGGVVGCSLAYQLARRGLDVVLLERDELGSQSTARCAGGVRQQFSSETNVRLQRLAVRLLRDFDAETGGHADFRQVGYLFLLARPEEAADFRRLVDAWHGWGLAEARWVSPEEAHRLVPVLDVEDVIGGTFCPTDGLASPADVTAGYAGAARRHGARLREHVAVTGVDVDGGRVRAVRTDAGDIATPVVFDCAGAWSAEVGRMAGVNVPVRPFRRHIFVTGAFPEVPRSTPMTVDFATSFYFHPEGDGVLLGMSDRQEPSTFSTDVDWELLERLVPIAAHRVPALERAGIRTAWAGLYETTPDHQAVLGPVEDVEGFWCACGFSGHGFMQAPAVGLVLAELLVEGRSEVDISPLSHGRFRRGELVAERNVI
ncbi:MAG TPA: FAD-binding oxidoreductase [Candidatus Dormibacteraeota bacterium]|nr:FAD-binding oxidoreductase [Candidatus Dormibacteraeota bacterium]